MQEIFMIIILIMSVVVHELAHGYTALYYGDQTARLAGRLTLNPLKHLDLVGSVIVPLLFILLPGNIVLGWAKPVPYNPYNLRDIKWGTIAVASAGVLTNFFIAFIFGMLIRLALAVGIYSVPFLVVSGLIVFINVILGVFNLVPIPPLDGSKILFSLLPARYQHIGIFLERYAIFILLFFIFFLWGLIQPIMFGLFKLFSGMGALEFFGLMGIL